jgi:hypothetical protein
LIQNPRTRSGLRCETDIAAALRALEIITEEKGAYLDNVVCRRPGNAARLSPHGEERGA